MSRLPADIIADAGFSVYLHGFSAIDSYIGLPAQDKPAVYILCGAELADLARLFDGLRYPGAALADAAVDYGKTWYFRCGEPRNTQDNRASFSFLEFYQNWVTRRFYDPGGIYPCLRSIKGETVQFPPETGQNDTAPARIGQWLTMVRSSADRALIDGAMIIARYFPETGVSAINALAADIGAASPGPPVGIEAQRLLLTGLLESANPSGGFELLKRCGFISAHWPELAVLDDVDQSKEFHPEGNAWKHTMEALRYRKSARPDLRLSLGLLLHDIGKPLSNSAGSRRFDGHAELGERQARRFLERLGFDAALAADVCYLVRNHMLPAALPRLPLIRTEEIMSSPLFPVLLELYRCDESSSFKGLDGYYQSSAAYQSFLKNRRNPYRSADGKKLNRKQIISR